MVTDAPPRWITTKQFAAVAGITFRAAKLATRRCADGGTWQGHQLAISSHHGRGGDRGLSYRICLDTLPADLQERALALFPGLSATANGASSPAGGSTSGPPDRAPARKCKVRRSDWNTERRLFLRRLAAKAGLGPEATESIAAELDQRVKSLWASHAHRAGNRTIARFAALDLYELAREAGAKLPEPELRALCVVPRSYVDQNERRKHRKSHVFRHDAKRFADLLPGVKRDRPLRPLEVVVVDGTNGDIYRRRADGSQQKLWRFHFYDAATGRQFVQVLIRPKGGGPRQEHVAAGLLTFATSIGIPEVVYYDRGSEYAPIKHLVEAGLLGSVRALPYGARSKIVEPAIRVYNALFLSQFDSYFGPNWSLKPTANVGRLPDGFEGSNQELFGIFERATALFNATPRDSLGGRSPNDLWQAALDSGWRPRRPDASTMAEALARTERRVVKRGVVRVDGIEYSSDALAAAWEVEGESVRVMVPIVKSFPPSVYTGDGRFIGLIYPIESFDMLDPAGAREAGRLKKLRRAGARTLDQAAPPADLAPYHQAFLELHEPPDDAVAGELVELPGEPGRAAAARKALPAPATRTRPTIRRSTSSWRGPPKIGAVSKPAGRETRCQCPRPSPKKTGSPKRAN